MALLDATARSVFMISVTPFAKRGALDLDSVGRSGSPLIRRTPALRCAAVRPTSRRRRRAPCGRTRRSSTIFSRLSGFAATLRAICGPSRPETAAL